MQRNSKCLKCNVIVEPIQSRKWSQVAENFIDQIACLKNWLFGKLFQSRKWIEKFQNFTAGIVFIKN